MVDGYVWVSGKLGVCFVIIGLGVINVVIVIGQVYVDLVLLLVIFSVNYSVSLGKGWGCLYEIQDQCVMIVLIIVFFVLVLSLEQLFELIVWVYVVFDSECLCLVYILILFDVFVVFVVYDWSVVVVCCFGCGVLCIEVLWVVVECLVVVW